MMLIFSAGVGSRASEDCCEGEGSGEEAGVLEVFWRIGLEMWVGFERISE